MKSKIINEIIYCSNDTINDRIILMRPILLSFTISIIIVILSGLVFSYSVPTKERGDGTGLGLYFIKKVVEKNNGNIYLISSIKSTTFCVNFSNN